MTVAQVRQEAAPAARTGAEALSLLAVPINAAVLQALAVEPMSLFDLRREVDSPPQTTMRAHLRALTRTGVVDRRRFNDFPGNVEYGLAESGRELLAVADVVKAWLESSPESPAAFGSGAARSAIRALVEGWSTSIVRALAMHPLSLTELDAIIAAVNYPSLERRLGAMRHEGLVEPLSSQGRGTPYSVSEWLRKAAAPLTAAARWERCQIGDEAPAITTRDAEAAFLLALPLLRLPASLSGSCRLAVQLDEGGKGVPAGVIASVREGRVEACETRLEGPADSWATGAPGAWFASVIERDPDGLRFGGNRKLAKEVVRALNEALFGLAARG